MTKSSDLPVNASPSHEEDEHVVQDGVTRRTSIGALAAVLAAPYADKANATETRANDTSFPAQASFNFRATIAEAVTDFSVGTYFTSTDTAGATPHPNELRIYQRTSNSPFYADQGDAAAPISKALLAASGGADNIGANDGASGTRWKTVQGFINKVLSSTGASVIGFLQAGSGAMARGVQDKIREIVSPEDFGCVGDGSTNDAKNFQRALNYAADNGRIVHLVSGKTYNCSGVTLTVSCPVYGNQATIKGCLQVTGSDIIIRDFQLIGTKSSIGIFLFGSTTIPTRYYRQKVQNVRITFENGVADSNTFGIYASNIDNLEVSGCNIKYGIHLIGCTDYNLYGNIFDGDNYSNNNELVHVSFQSCGQIVNNIFKDSLDNYIDLYLSGSKTIISNNRFLGNKLRLGTAIELKISLSDNAKNSSGDVLGWEEQILIVGNYFSNTKPQLRTMNSIISIYYIDNRNSPSFSWINTPRNITITNNIFDGIDGTAITSGYVVGIYMNSIAGAIISENTFRNFNKSSGVSDISSCIWIENCQDIVVDNNRMNVNGGTGVSLHRLCTNITVSNNHMLDDINKSLSLAFGIRITKEGLRSDPIVTYSKFIGNTIYCTIGAFHQLYYASGYMNDCVISGNIFREQSDFQNINRCVISGNKFGVGASRIQAVQLGSAAAVCAYNTFANNQIESDATIQKPGLYVYRMRGSNINGNTVRNATYGFLFIGTNTTGEMDYLNIKDNFSVCQTQRIFPAYSAMTASDTASLQAANNQKIT